MIKSRLCPSASSGEKPNSTVHAVFQRMIMPARSAQMSASATWARICSANPVAVFKNAAFLSKPVVRWSGPGIGRLGLNSYARGANLLYVNPTSSETQVSYEMSGREVRTATDHKRPQPAFLSAHDPKTHDGTEADICT